MWLKKKRSQGDNLIQNNLKTIAPNKNKKLSAYT